MRKVCPLLGSELNQSAVNVTPLIEWNYCGSVNITCTQHQHVLVSKTVGKSLAICLLWFCVTCAFSTPNYCCNFTPTTRNPTHSWHDWLLQGVKYQPNTHTHSLTHTHTHIFTHTTHAHTCPPEQVTITNYYRLKTWNTNGDIMASRKVWTYLQC